MQILKKLETEPSWLSETTPGQISKGNAVSCGGLNVQWSHSLRHLNSWFPVGATVCEVSVVRKPFVGGITSLGADLETKSLVPFQVTHLASHSGLKMWAAKSDTCCHASPAMMDSYPSTVKNPSKHTHPEVALVMAHGVLTQHQKISNILAYWQAPQTLMFAVVLVMLTTIWNRPTCLSTDKWTNNNGVISSTKKSFLSFAATWLETEDISVTEAR